MITELTVLLASVLFLNGCSGSKGAGNPLLAGLELAPASIQASCVLAANKCTRCHPVGRLINTLAQTPQHWQRYVSRMRRMPASRISRTEADQIVRCLVYRTFGTDALLKQEIPAEGNR